MRPLQWAIPDTQKSLGVLDFYQLIPPILLLCAMADLQWKHTPELQNSTRTLVRLVNQTGCNRDFVS